MNKNSLDGARLSDVMCGVEFGVYVSQNRALDLEVGVRYCRGEEDPECRNEAKMVRRGCAWRLCVVRTIRDLAVMCLPFPM